jgi:phosphate transport system protein
MAVNRGQFEQSLEALRQALIEMGEKVERAIAEAVRSLKETDLDTAARIVEQDAVINRLEEKIDEIGTRLIATQQPVAKDLRTIIAAFKMAGDLERMGDLAVNIAKAALRIGSSEPAKPLVDIPRMAEIVQNMIGASIRSYIHQDVDQAFQMARLDDEVDQLYAQIMRETFVYAMEDTRSVNQLLQLCFVARDLERMADHATNLGESVVYLVKGTRPDLNQ